MTKPRLLAKTPDNSDVNTLVLDQEEIIENPERRRYAVIEYSVKDVTRPVHGGDPVARIQITHFEDVAADGEKLLDRAFSNRTGQASRPSPEEVADSPLDLSVISGIDYV